MKVVVVFDYPEVGNSSSAFADDVIDELMIDLKRIADNWIIEEVFDE
jgi:L-ribulose-5-phosphate 3-epimerase UlaE